MIQVSRLFVYPVKSLRGIEVNQFEVDARGPKWDRHWMLVNDKGLFMTQREYPQMATIKTELTSDHLILSKEGFGETRISLRQIPQETAEIHVWSDLVRAGVEVATAHTWLTQALNVECKIYRLLDEHPRLVQKKYGGPPAAQTGFADTLPFLLVNQLSLDELNTRVEGNFNVERFRPNIVVIAKSAYAEDQWAKVKIGAIEFTLPRPCARCRIITLNPETGVGTHEPLKTLARYRRDGSKVLFGENMIHLAQGHIKKGDELSILEIRT